MVVYIRTQGARIIREGRHLLVKKEQDTLHTLFTYKLDQLVLFGSVEITHAALVSLMRHAVDVVFLSVNGRFLGRLSSAEAKNVFLRKRQFELLDNPGFGLLVTKSIVAGKLANLATLLNRIKRTKDEPLAGVKAQAIQELLPLLASAESVDSVRGYEGKGTALTSAYHKQCISCHKEKGKGPIACGQCHKR